MMSWPAACGPFHHDGSRKQADGQAPVSAFTDVVKGVLRINNVIHTGRKTLMKFRMVHENYNVADLAASMAFYEKALGLKEVRRKTAPDGAHIIVYLSNEESDFELELTWLRDHPQKYDIGEEEFHLAFKTDDFEAAHKLHEEMGCICFENPAMGIYFIQDPDGYWLEIIPASH